MNERSADEPKESATTFWHPAASAERYERLELLGRGGMGEVYRARQTDLDRIVALKLVLNERSSDPQFLARFRREALAMARLSHPHIVGVHDFGEWQGRPFLAMEYVDGLTLRAWLQETPRTVSDILSVAQQAGKGLAAAHSAGLIHRDLFLASVPLRTD